MAYFMGIDLGTSSLKAMIIDGAGKVAAQAARSYQFDSPKLGYAEQGLSTWWDACCEATREALGLLGKAASEVAAVSFSGQMHGAVLLDERLREVRPAILHCDARSGKQVREIAAALSRAGLLESLLNPVYTGFLLPSLVWVRENEPERYSAVRHAMLPKDYLKLRLCGELASDYSDASATLAFDIAGGRWSREVLEVLGLSASIFPECAASDAPVGKVTAEASAATGLAEGTLVVNGGGDQVMQAIGNGAIRAGQATVNIGSSGQVCFQSDRPIADPRSGTNTFCGYDLGKWLTMGATMTAGLSLKWLGKLLGGADYRDLDEGAGKVAPGSEGLVFLPYLNGERTPHLDPDLCGMILGLHLGTGRYEMARAVMEGVAYSLMQCIEVCGRLGLRADELIASGGGAASPIWLQIQADVYGLPLKTAAVGEQAVMGAAIAAGSGAGAFAGIEEGCAVAVRYRDEIYEPDPGRHEAYLEYYRLFKDAYGESAGLLRRATELGRA